MFIHLWQIDISTYQQEYLNDSTFRATGGGRMIVAMFNSITVKINDVFMCSDSKTVLKLIRNENVKYKTNIMHRVSQIKKNADVSSWEYIPSVLQKLILKCEFYLFDGQID